MNSNSEFPINILSNELPKWWQSSVFYEIYIASFQDGNGDGIGDFEGLTSRLDYLQKLGVNGLWVTPFYPSPKVDNGYDVADYCDVDSDFGSLADFDHFIEQAHQRNIKVIIDVVLNHVSTKHPWFMDALSNPASKYRDYFFFQDVPNNWESFFGGSAWEQEPNAEQYYYHKFSPEQADLNWQNKAVKDELRTVLKFWMDRGVDGFRFDVINFLSCNGIGEDNLHTDDKGQQIHDNDIDQPDIYACISELCSYVRGYGTSTGKDYFLVGEVGHEDLSKLAPYQSDDLLDVVFNFNLGAILSFDINNVHKQLVAMDNSLAGLPTLFFNSHDMSRAMSRLCHNNAQQATALATLTLMAKGVSFLYFGEEIGMPDFIPKNIDEMRDIQAVNHYELTLADGKTTLQAYDKALKECRDKSRLYMQWNDNKFSGFSASKPWIGETIPKNMPTVEKQCNDPDSLWHWYQKLITLRREYQALHFGNYEVLSLDNKLLSISRRWQNQVIHIRINFNDVKQPINHDDSHTILASKGLNLCEQNYLLPYGTIITRETLNVH